VTGDASSRAHVMSLPPGSNERATAARAWLLAVCVASSYRTRADPDPAFIAAIEALPDLGPATRLAPEMRVVIEEAVGIA